MDERLVVGSPVGDFELLFCHVISLQDQECGDLILTTAKSSIYSRGQFGYRKLCTLRLFFDLSTLAGLSRRNLPEAGILLLFQM